MESRALLDRVEVASFTLAWIETKLQLLHFLQQVVASFTLAWIETLQCFIQHYNYLVASFTLAWIETCTKLV